MPDSVRATRKNGLSRPYTPAQVSTWIFLPFLVLGFLFCVSPILPLVASIACTIIFCAFAIASVYYAYMAMKIDPSDPRLLNANRTSNTDDNNNQNENGTGCSGSLCHVNPEEPTKQCWICDIQVGEKSMHCKFCNKCVDHFDHHCMCTLRICTYLLTSVVLLRCGAVTAPFKTQRGCFDDQIHD